MTQSQQSSNPEANVAPKTLRFVGPQHERHLSAADLKRIDPEYAGQILHFTPDNNYQVEIEKAKLTGPVVEYLTAEGEFVVEDADKHNQTVQDKLGIAGPPVYTGPLIPAS